MLRLTAQQAAAVSSLDWLLSTDDRDRRTGRTYAMAVAILRHACRRHPAWIYVEDHTFPSGVFRGDQHLLRLIVDLARSLDIDIEVHPGSALRFRLQRVSNAAIEALFKGFKIDPSKEEPFPDDERRSQWERLSQEDDAV